MGEVRFIIGENKHASAIGGCGDQAKIVGRSDVENDAHLLPVQPEQFFGTGIDPAETGDGCPPAIPSPSVDLVMVGSHFCRCRARREADAIEIGECSGGFREADQNGGFVAWDEADELDGAGFLGKDFSGLPGIGEIEVGKEKSGTVV